MWKLNILPKIKFFAWLLLRKRLKTRDRLSIFDYIDDNSCPLCDSDSETASHLFGYCPLNPEVWNLSGFNTNIDWLTGYLQVFKELFLDKSYHEALFAKALTLCCHLWKKRNDTIFHDKIGTTLVVVAATTASLLI